MVQTITFLLAMAAYLGLTIGVIRAASGRLVRLHPVTAVLTVAHVTLVWCCRYHWSVSQAARNGLAGPIVFHSALVLVVAATFTAPPASRRLVMAAFAVVTAGALGAVFRYDVVTVYRAPVVLCGLAGLVALLGGWRSARAR